MTPRSAILGAAAALALAAAPARAAVITNVLNQALTTTASVVTLPSGSLSFTAATTDYGQGSAVATGGTAAITTIFGGLADYTAGTVFDGTASYAAFSTATVIPFSAADDLIGFSYTGTDGTHLGYAEVNGATLVGYAYESVAGASITANALSVAAVPEPASLALLAAGVVGVGLTRRKRQPV